MFVLDLYTRVIISPDFRVGGNCLWKGRGGGMGAGCNLLRLLERVEATQGGSLAKAADII